jgi:Asparagine synthase
LVFGTAAVDVTNLDRKNESPVVVRVPLLDHTLVKWAARLPPPFKLHRGELKRAQTTLLPSSA